ncbi:MAG: protein kinase [Deltaproteobacteria bacterium]|nr:protein kinase [Deltaproteobacteria bacterium]
MSETLRPSTGPSAPDPLIGQTINGSYEILRLLGAGGMGNVYEAKHTRLPKKFAIKVVRSDLAKDEAAFERFKREADIASSLGNKHIVEVHDWNVLPDGSPYMVMEFLTGEDLANRLGRHKRLGPDEAVQILTQVVSALESAHARGIVHRDIKPENIFLAQIDDEPDFVKLLDFGLSKIRGSQKRLTANLSVLGTPWYMSPEQARGDSDLDHRTDLYALAVVLYQVLCGRVPFEGENVYGVLTQIATQQPPPITQFAPDLPKQLEIVLQKALAKEPNGRYPSVREFWEAATAALGISVVRKSLPSARVPGPSGEPFRVPTPSQLHVGGMPTITSSQEKLSQQAQAQPIPLTNVAKAKSKPDAKADSSPSMILLHQAAFGKRNNSKLIALGVGGAVLLGLIGWGVYHVTRPPVVERAVVPVPLPTPPEPAPIKVPEPPKPAVADVKPPEPPKPIDVKPPVAEVKPPAPKPTVTPAVDKPKPTPKPKPSGHSKKPHGGGELINPDDVIN